MKNYLTKREQRTVNKSIRKFTKARRKKDYSTAYGVIMLAMLFVTFTSKPAFDLMDSISQVTYQARTVFAKTIILKKVPVIKDAEYWKAQSPIIADEYGIKRSTLYNMVDYETGGSWDVNQQSNVRYNKDYTKWSVKKGDREESYGLAQIHLPSHSSITKAQATDGDYALRFMAESISRGDFTPWYRTAKLLGYIK